MRGEIQAFVKEFLSGALTSSAPPPVPIDTLFWSVAEVGSLDINGGVRHLFPEVLDDGTYYGIDLVDGRGVDYVGRASVVLGMTEPNADEIDKYDGIADHVRFDLALYLDTAEHDEAFWETLTAIGSRLAEGAYLIIAVPGPEFPEHERPDRWRFLRDAHQTMFALAGCEVLYFRPLPSGWVALGRRC